MNFPIIHFCQFYSRHFLNFQFHWMGYKSIHYQNTLCIPRSLFVSKKFPKAFVQQEGKEELKLSIKNSSRLESRWQLIQITRYPWNRRYTYRNRKESVTFESLLSKWKSIWALTKALDTHVTIHKENCSLSASFNPTSFSIQRVFRSLIEDPISVSGARFCSLFLQVIVP